MCFCGGWFLQGGHDLVTKEAGAPQQPRRRLHGEQRKSHHATLDVGSRWWSMSRDLAGIFGFRQPESVVQVVITLTKLFFFFFCLWKFFCLKFHLDGFGTKVDRGGEGGFYIVGWGMWNDDSAPGFWLLTGEWRRDHALLSGRGWVMKNQD